MSSDSSRTSRSPGRSPYDEGFFEHHGAISRRSARRMVPAILELLEPARPTAAVDVGCGAGAFLAELAEAGVERLHGFDTAVLAAESLHGPAEWFRTVDLERLASNRPADDRAAWFEDAAGEPLRVDLALCLEVAEHLSPATGEALVEQLVRLAPVVVFSAAVPQQGGTGHVHEAWPEHWAGRFAEHGYRAADALRPRLWNDPQVAWWYPQNTLIYAAPEALSRSPALAAAAEATDPETLARIHPRHYLLKAEGHRLLEDPASASLKTALKRLPAIARATLARRFGRGEPDRG